MQRGYSRESVPVTANQMYWLERLGAKRIPKTRSAAGQVIRELLAKQRNRRAAEGFKQE